MNGLKPDELACKGYTGYVMTRVECKCDYYSTATDRAEFAIKQLELIQFGIELGLSLDQMETFARNEIVENIASFTEQRANSEWTEGLSEVGRELMGVDDDTLAAYAESRAMLTATIEHMSHLEWELARAEIAKAL